VSVAADPKTRSPRTATRLLEGLTGGEYDSSLDAHLARWGAPSDPHTGVLTMLEESGLSGHGGAYFPVAAKWRAVMGSRQRRTVVIANGAESEPASSKDGFLLTRTPHLVLDGLAVAAQTLRATRAIVHVAPASRTVVERAVAERGQMGLDAIGIEVVEAPDRYLAGQESAVVNRLNGHQVPIPSFVGLRSIRERGVDGRPTLVQNAETLAHVALIARFGPEWFRECEASSLVATAEDGSPPRNSRSWPCSRRPPGDSAQPWERAWSHHSPRGFARWPKWQTWCATWTARERGNVGPACTV